MAQYIILRDKNMAFRIRGGAGVLEATPNALDVPSAPSLEVAEMTAAEVHDAQRDASVLGIARSMPTRVIERFADAVDAAATGTPTWGVEKVGAVASPFTGAGVRVAVLDTGIDADHPAFQGVTLVQRDFTGSGNGDGNGHGTHCAGTIFGREVEGTRIGVAPGVTQALIGKVLGDDGSGGSEMLFNAMTWASENDAQVISMSLGFDFPGLGKRLIEDNQLPPDLATSIALEGYRMNLLVFDRILSLIRARAAFNGGTVVCAASGNESHRDIDPNYEVSASVPAAAEGIVSVGALDTGAPGLTVANFSNTNPTLSAPGVNIVSAKAGGGLLSLRGTSMACPHVAGVAALWWEALAQSPVPQGHRSVEARLMASAKSDVFAPGVEVADRGQGLVQAPMGAGV